MSPAEEKALLQQGIAAARAGDKTTARTKFRELTAHNFDNELAWLWLASVADTPAHAVACLRRVLQINGSHEKARAALFRLLMEQAIQVARAGDKPTAYATFVECSSLDASNELVWTWMASTASGPAQALDALRHVLHLNPTHQQAGRAYKKLVVSHGIDLAQSGDTANARELLTEATRLEPENETVWLWLARSVPQSEAIPYYERLLTLNPAHDAAQAALQQLRPAPPPPVETPSYDEYAHAAHAAIAIDDAPMHALAHADAAIDSYELQQVDEYDGALEVSGPVATDAGPTMATQPSTHEEFVVYQSGDISTVWASESHVAADASASAAAVEEMPAAEEEMAVASDVDSYVAASEHTYAVSEMASVEDHAISAASADSVEMELDSVEGSVDIDAGLAASGGDEADAELAAAAMAPEVPPPTTPSNIVVAWNCPICLSGAPEEAHRCPTCGSVPTLVDPDLLLDTEPVDRRYVLQVVARMKNRRVNGASALFDHHLTLGLAYINAGRFPEGMTHLRKASESRPRDAEFKAQVDAVERRAKAKAAGGRAPGKVNGKAVKPPAPAAPVNVPLAPVAAAGEDGHDAAHATNGNGNNSGRRIILVVDDSPTIQKVVSVTLEAHGHEVVTASDGMEALSKLRTLKPDLVLLDITMPHMDGYQLCRIMRSNDITRNVPIVMLSGKDGLFDKMRGRMAGAASYITKPFAPSALPPLIDKYCKRAS